MTRHSRCHAWVSISMSRVDVIVDPGGRPFPVDREDGHIGVAIGCDHCGVSLTEGNVTTACQPEGMPVG